MARPIQANHNQIIMMGNYVGMTGNSSIKKNETDNFCEMTTWFARETQWHFFPQDVSWSKKITYNQTILLHFNS